MTEYSEVTLNERRRSSKVRLVAFKKSNLITIVFCQNRF